MKMKLATAGLFATILSGCASLDQAAEDLWNWDIRGTQVTSGPAMSRAAPLVVPPDYALEPTEAAARPQGSAAEQTLETLFGGPAARSAAERTISTAPGSADLGIRTAVGDPNTNTVNKGAVTRDIIAAPEGDGQVAQAVIPQ